MKSGNTIIGKIFVGAIALCLVLMPKLLFAQGANARLLSLEETLTIALNQSFDIQDEKFNLEQSRLSLQSRQRSLRTRVDFRLNAPTLDQGITSVPDAAGTQFFDNNEISTQGVLQVTQPVLWSDGEFSLNGVFNTLDEEREQTARKTQQFSDRITFKYVQPLFQPNATKITLRRTERQLEQSQRNFESTQNGIYLNVMRSYYNLVQAKRKLQIEEENVTQNEDTYTQTQNKFRAGILAEVDALQSEVERDQARNSYKIQELEYRRQLDEFKRFIGLPLDENIDVSADVEVTEIQINNEKAFEEALARDARLRTTELQILNDKDAIKTTKNNRKFNADLELEFGLSEVDEFSGTFRDNVFRDFSQTRRVSLNFTIPIFDWGKQALDVENAQLTVKSRELNLENQKRVLRRNIQDILNQITNARERMRLQAKSEEIAVKSYSISQQRYSIGEIDSENLFLANKRLLDTKTAVLQSKIDYLLAIAELNRATYWDFINNKPLSETLAGYTGNN